MTSALPPSSSLEPFSVIVARMAFEGKPNKSKPRPPVVIFAGYTKMAISQFEASKASPPQGQRLEDLIAALDASSEQAEHLRFLSARARYTILDDIYEFFYTDSSLYMAVRETKAAGEGNKGLVYRLASMGGGDETE